MSKVKDLFENLEVLLGKLQSIGKLENFEGHVAQAPYMINFLQETVKELPPCGRILQIGFNAGHSTLIMLEARPDIHVTSVDLGKTYIQECDDYINKIFPGHHTLIIGNSLDVVPSLTEGHFNLFFIDGGHEYDVAKCDLENCYKLSREDDIIVIDDIVRLIDCSEDSKYTLGPTKAYDEMLKSGKITHYAHCEVTNRGMSVGIILNKLG